MRKGFASIFFVLLLIIVSISAFIVYKSISLNPSVKISAYNSNIVVDYSAPKRTLSPFEFSMDESHYGGGKNITNDPIQQAKIKTLGMNLMRLDLAYNTPGDPTSGIVCYAGGCNKTIPGINWVNGVRAAGAEPEIKVRISNAMPSGYWASDAANEVTYFNKTQGIKPVNRWIIGNEPDGNGLDATTYSNGFVAMYKTMKAVDPTIKIGGPAVAFWNQSYIQTFLTILNSNGVVPDFVDFHSYGTGGTNTKTDAQLLDQTVSYENNANKLRTMLVSTFGTTKASSIDIEMGEWNLSWSGDSRQLTQLGVIWSTSALGHMVNAGEISREYADKNGSLGSVCDANNITTGSITYNCVIDDPMPIYHGMGMFTGESLFPRFGSILVTSTTSLANIEVFSSDNPKNIVVVNKDPSISQSGTFFLNGVASGSAVVWQKGPLDGALVNKGSVTITNGTFSYNLAPYTVYTFVVSVGAASSPIPLPTASPIPTASPTASNNVVYLWCEAEKTNLVSPMVTGNDSQASNGVYVYGTVTDSVNMPPTTTGLGTLGFSVPVTGNYAFWTKMNYGGEFQNSYWAQFDGGTLYKVGNENTGYNAWRWVDWRDGQLSTSNLIKINLASGTHTLKFFGREANTKIDKFLLTNDPAYIPSGVGAPANCGN